MIKLTTLVGGFLLSSSLWANNLDQQYATQPSDFELQFIESQVDETWQQVTSSQELVKITVEPQGNAVHSIILQLNENGEVVNFVRQANDSFQEIPFEDVDNKDVVLAQAEGRDAVLLGCYNCNRNEHGNLRLTYLYNGITMDYRSFGMIIEKDSSTGKWSLMTENRTSIYRMKLHTRSIFGRTIGISGVSINEDAGIKTPATKPL